MQQLIFYSLIGGLFSLIGGLVLLWQTRLTKHIMTPLLAFAAGAFLTTSFAELIPEALENVDNPHTLLLVVLSGFIAFFVLERFLMRYVIHQHAEGHSDHTESLPFLLILGDSIHNFLDGVAIGLAYIADPVLGLVTTLAVSAHEIPQEIGDFSILLHQEWKRRDILLVNVGQSLLTVPGALLGYFGGQMLEPQLPYLLAFTAGIFLYIGGSDLLPEIHHRAGHKQFARIVVPLLVSVLLIKYLIGVFHH